MNLKLEDVLWLLQVDELPIAPGEIPWVISATEDLIEKNGLKWIYDNHDRLVWELTQF